MIKRIFVGVIIYLISSIFVYIGVNLLLTQIFDSVQKLSYSKILLLTVAIDFIAMPVKIGINMFTNKQIKNKVSDDKEEE